ncbi:DUF4123 domain-containing protein [Noviherbaspirillum sp. ST9]|uniref:DUF4123 domain-containing protein n=1 Tax=Noviherbaspirillum sp. ST9 TaxID=3401606 RepID=UPI003B589210
MKNSKPTRKLINSHVPGWMDDFEKTIASLQEKWPPANVFALFDCVFNEPCLTQIKRSQIVSRCLYDLSKNPSPELEAVSPVLVPLTDALDARWREAVQLTDGYPMLSLIVTPESLDQLAQRLHPWCIVKVDGEPYVFRFPDTRRLPGVIEVLTPQQHAAFFGPAYAWLYRTRSAEWKELPIPDASLPPDDDVKLSAEQFVQLIEDSEADEIAAHFHVHEPMLILPYQPSEAYDLIAQALKHVDNKDVERLDRMECCRLFLQQPQQ